MRLDLLPAQAVMASNRIAAHVRRTPLEFSPWFSECTGANVYLKLENLQRSGSFKLRGAYNKLLSLSPEERRAGCVAASSGNHGAAIACAMAELGVEGIVFVPEGSSPAKVAAIRRAGAEVRHVGEDGVETENHARGYADEHSMHYLSPYNDADVIAGQGSCGVEIASELDDIAALFVAVGGGGLLGGVGSFLKSVNPGMDCVACQPLASPVMTRSLEAGRIVEMPSEATLSDGTAGGIEQGAITFDICRAITSRSLLVEEEKIAEAMRAFIDAHHMLLEGAAGVALAGLLAEGEGYRGRNVVAIVCGANISREMLKRII